MAKQTAYEFVNEFLKSPEAEGSQGTMVRLPHPEGFPIEMGLYRLSPEEFEKGMLAQRDGYERWFCVVSLPEWNQTGGALVDLLVSEGQIIDVLFAGKARYLRECFFMASLLNDNKKHPLTRRSLRLFLKSRPIRARVLEMVIGHLFEMTRKFMSAEKANLNMKTGKLSDHPYFKKGGEGDGKTG